MHKCWECLESGAAEENTKCALHHTAGSAKHRGNNSYIHQLGWLKPTSVSLALILLIILRMNCFVVVKLKNNLTVIHILLTLKAPVRNFLVVLIQVPSVVKAVRPIADIFLFVSEKFAFYISRE